VRTLVGVANHVGATITKVATCVQRWMSEPELTTPLPSPPVSSSTSISTVRDHSQRTPSRRWATIHRKRSRSMTVVVAPPRSGGLETSRLGRGRDRAGDAERQLVESVQTRSETSRGDLQTIRSGRGCGRRLHSKVAPTRRSVCSSVTGGCFERRYIQPTAPSSVTVGASPSPRWRRLPMSRHEPDPRLRHVRDGTWLATMPRQSFDKDLTRVVNAPEILCALEAPDAASSLRRLAS
jgi:hypothetical protein